METNKSIKGVTCEVGDNFLGFWIIADIIFSKNYLKFLVSNVTIDNWNVWDITGSVTNPAKKTFWNPAVECNISYLSNGREAL